MSLMKRFTNPSPKMWPQILSRPLANDMQVEQTVSSICQRVRQQGDKALFAYSSEFDSLQLDRLRLTTEEISSGAQLIDPTLARSIELARKNIVNFQSRQSPPIADSEVIPGVLCYERKVPIQRVGLYIPGGSAPLFSTLLMLAIPAQLAGCSSIALVTPPCAQAGCKDAMGLARFVHPALLYCCQVLGLNEIYLVGGAQAIAALAYGTESIKRVDKIFGPGNRYVTAAKRQVSQQGVAIDMPAGPSEVMVLADESANTEFVASDLIAQAEHGRDSQALLITTSKRIWEQVEDALAKQLETLPRRAVAEAALQASSAVLVDNLDSAFAMLNEYAAEHLILALQNAMELSSRVVNAGSVFLGNLSSEAAGDYATGTNHVLPTYGYARSTSGVSADSFMKRIYFQQLSATGVRAIAESVECMAQAEGLAGHARSMQLRREWLNSVGVK